MTPPEEPVIDGWKDISSALNVAERTARDYADQNVDPLPVRVDHRGRVYIYRAALKSWINRNDMPYQPSQELRRLRAEQKRRAGRAE